MPTSFVPTLLAASTNLLASEGNGVRPALPYGPQRKPAGVTSKIKGNLAGGTSVLVGALRGSLYALPADHITIDARSPAPAALMPPPVSGKCTECDARPLAQLVPFVPMSGGDTSGLHDGDAGGGSGEPGAGGPMLEDAGVECRADEDLMPPLVVKDDDASRAGGLVPLQPSSQGVGAGLGGLVCPHLALGLYQLSDPGEGAPTLPWLPESLQQAVKVSASLGRVSAGRWSMP